MGDWVALFLFIGLDLLLLVISIVLLCGRGSWLIAGYNTASEEERKKYDEKKLCRSMGVTLLVFTLGMAGLIVVTFLVEFRKLWEETVLTNTAFLFGAVTIAAVIIEIIYGNTRCKRKIQNNKDNE